MVYNKTCTNPFYGSNFPRSIENRFFFNLFSMDNKPAQDEAKSFLARLQYLATLPLTVIEYGICTFHFPFQHRSADFLRRFSRLNFNPGVGVGTVILYMLLRSSYRGHIFLTDVRRHLASFSLADVASSPSKCFGSSTWKLLCHATGRLGYLQYKSIQVLSKRTWWQIASAIFS